MLKEIKLNDVLHIDDDDFSGWKIRMITSWADGDENNPIKRYKKNPADVLEHLLYHYGKSKPEYKVNTKVIGLIRIRQDLWLFTKVVKITKDLALEKGGVGYEYETIDDFNQFEGRLIVRFHNTAQQMIRVAKSVINKMEVQSLLDSEWTGAEFPGYENVNISWDELHTIVKRPINSWEVALKNQKGIYLITDTKTNKRYVGSAYGKEMIWGRWREYAKNLHGNNVGLKKQFKEQGKEYLKDNYRYSILEIADKNTSDQYIIERENYWKEVLLSRHNEFGLNEN